MIYMFILCIFSLIYNMIREFLFIKERNMLLDRILAKDLYEYKAFEDKPKTNKKEKEEDKKGVNWI